MNHLFGEMIDTLVAAQCAVREEVEAHAGQPVPDSGRLLQLGQLVRSFAHQTDSQLLMMVERDAPELLLERVEDLFDFFHGVEDRIEGLLARVRRNATATGRT